VPGDPTARRHDCAGGPTRGQPRFKARLQGELEANSLLQSLSGVAREHSKVCKGCVSDARKMRNTRRSHSYRSPRRESALTGWGRREILRQSGCPCLRRILRIGLHPHQSRKTSQTVDCRIPFENTRSSRSPRAQRGWGARPSTARGAGRGSIPLIPVRLSAAVSQARSRALFLVRSLEPTGPRAAQLSTRAAGPEGDGAPASRFLPMRRPTRPGHGPEPSTKFQEDDLGDDNN